MDMTRVFTVENYELQCTATAVESGRFAPSLSVEKQVWPTRRRQIAVPRGQYTSEETAIEAAYSQGVAWIRDYG